MKTHFLHNKRTSTHMHTHESSYEEKASLILRTFYQWHCHICTIISFAFYIVRYSSAFCTCIRAAYFSLKCQKLNILCCRNPRANVQFICIENIFTLFETNEGLKKNPLE